MLQVFLWIGCTAGRSPTSPRPIEEAQMWHGTPPEVHTSEEVDAKTALARAREAGVSIDKRAPDLSGDWKRTWPAFQSTEEVIRRVRLQRGVYSVFLRITLLDEGERPVMHVEQTGHEVVGEASRCSFMSRTEISWANDLASSHYGKARDQVIPKAGTPDCQTLEVNSSERLEGTTAVGQVFVEEPLRY